MLQVAIPALSVVVDEVQAVIPAVPLTVHETVPVGVVPPVGPESVAVKVTLVPRVVGEELVTTLAGATLAIVKLLELTAPVTPVMPTGVAVKVYEPAVLTTRLEKVATPPLKATVPVPEVNELCGLPLLMVMVTEPLAVVTKFP